MKRLCFFDAVCIFTAIALCFSVGFHVGKEKDNSTESHAVVTIKLEKTKLSDNHGDLLIDGKYKCDPVNIADGILTVNCRVKQLEAGFLFSGTKYISVNQPIEIIGHESYLYGRISSIMIIAY